ncbi:CU044_2847 family protein [Streptomyces phytophilus]|uniref:CU044_2847 family protein n=1 Tax=Streptomyces phytophilus TaxID=722715 RepID=UPI002867D7C8|nr:CU044_2847 family protein [Streptomyces phytophilus]
MDHSHDEVAGTSVGRLSLASGKEVLFEVMPNAVPASGEGPVKAGRVTDAVREVPRSLLEALAPVQEMAGAVAAQLRQAGPAEVEVEFGVDLSAQAGVIVSKGGAAAHLKVRLLWQAGAGDNVRGG